MIIYRSDKKGFIEDTRSCAIVEKLMTNFRAAEGRHASPGEERAWQSSLQYVANAVDCESVPSDAGVAIEYQIPSCAKRVDVLLSGFDAENRPNLVVIELKQWSETAATDEDGILAAPRYGAALARGPHPSYQAWSYAELLRGFNTACAVEPAEQHAASRAPQHAGIAIAPCAYLHNHSAKGAEQTVRDPRYEPYLKAAPVFLAGPKEQKKLREFLSRFITTGDAGQIIERVEMGEIRPSKALADAVSSMLRGNREFVLVDEQKTVYEHVLSLVKHKAKSKNADLEVREAAAGIDRQVVIVRGGPGTGKSVVAVNLLAALTEKRILTCYVSKNAAPRTVYAAKLAGTKTLKKTVISNLFKGSDWAWDVPPEAYGAFGCLLVDEAHRLREKSGIFGNKGENQIRELIRAARVSVFFMMTSSAFTSKISVPSPPFAKPRRSKGRPSKNSNFRASSAARAPTATSRGLTACSGSARPRTVRSKARITTFRVYDSAASLYDALQTENARGAGHEARLLAGYCWPWISKKCGRPRVDPRHRARRRVLRHSLELQ